MDLAMRCALRLTAVEGIDLETFCASSSVHHTYWFLLKAAMWLGIHVSQKSPVGNLGVGICSKRVTGGGCTILSIRLCFYFNPAD